MKNVKNGVKNEGLQYFWGSLKNPIFRRGIHEKPIYRGDCLKRDGGAWTVCRFKGVLGKKEREGGGFVEGVDILMHTMYCLIKIGKL